MQVATIFRFQIPGMAPMEILGTSDFERADLLKAADQVRGARTFAEAAVYLGVGYSTVRNMTADGRLTVADIGTVTQASLDKYLESQERKPKKRK